MDNQNPFGTPAEPTPIDPQAQTPAPAAEQPAVPEIPAMPEQPVAPAAPEQPFAPEQPAAQPPVEQTTYAPGQTYGQPAAPEQPFAQPVPPAYDQNAYGQQQPPQQGYAQPGYGQQPPPQQPYYQPGYQQVPAGNNNKAVIALILGIASIVLPWFSSFIGFAAYIGIACGIVGIVMAIQARKQMPAGTTGMATAGLVLSIIGLAITALLLIIGLCTICTVYGSLSYLF